MGVKELSGAETGARDRRPWAGHRAGRVAAGRESPAGQGVGARPGGRGRGCGGSYAVRPETPRATFSQLGGPNLTIPSSSSSSSSAVQEVPLRDMSPVPGGARRAGLLARRGCGALGSSPGPGALPKICGGGATVVSGRTALSRDGAGEGAGWHGGGPPGARPTPGSLGGPWGRRDSWSGLGGVSRPDHVAKMAVGGNRRQVRRSGVRAGRAGPQPGRARPAPRRPALCRGQGSFQEPNPANRIQALPRRINNATGAAEPPLPGS